MPEGLQTDVYGTLTQGEGIPYVNITQRPDTGTAYERCLVAQVIRLEEKEALEVVDRILWAVGVNRDPSPEAQEENLRLRRLALEPFGFTDHHEKIH